MQWASRTEPLLSRYQTHLVPSNTRLHFAVRRLLLPVLYENRVQPAASCAYDSAVLCYPEVDCLLLTALQVVAPLAVNLCSRLAGLDVNGYDRARCQEEFEAYKACKEKEVRPQLLPSRGAKSSQRCKIHSSCITSEKSLYGKSCCTGSADGTQGSTKTREATARALLRSSRWLVNLRLVTGQPFCS